MRQIPYEIASSMAQSLSFKRVSTAGKLLGYLMWHLLPERRKIASTAISLHLDKDRKQTQSLARSNFQHTGRSFLEIFLNRRLDHRFMQTRLSIPDPKHFFSIIEINRPIVATTAHLGAWELLAGVLRLYFPDRPSQIVVRQSKDTHIRRIMDHFRGSENVEIVHRDQAARNVLRCLQKDGITAFLVDHNCGRSQAVFLPFFKKLAAVNMGPAVLAVRAKALLWPVFLLRNGSGAYTLQAYQPLDTVSLEGTPKDKITYAAEFYTQAVEKMIRRYPEQWYWMHRRWKTRPHEEESAVRKRIGQAPSV